MNHFNMASSPVEIMIDLYYFWLKLRLIKSKLFQVIQNTKLNSRERFDLSSWRPCNCWRPRNFLIRPGALHFNISLHLLHYKLSSWPLFSLVYLIMESKWLQNIVVYLCFLFFNKKTNKQTKKTGKEHEKNNKRNNATNQFTNFSSAWKAKRSF